MIDDSAAHLDESTLVVVPHPEVDKVTADLQIITSVKEENKDIVVSTTFASSKFICASSQKNRVTNHDDGISKSNAVIFENLSFGLIRASTLPQKFEDQLRLSKRYQEMAATIIELIQVNASEAGGGAKYLTSDELSHKVGRYLEREFSQIEFDSEKDTVSCKSTANDTEKSPAGPWSRLTSYKKILAFDLVKQAQIQKCNKNGRSATHCIALTQKNVRCGNLKKIDNQILKKLLEELVNLRRPIIFSEAVKILKNIIDVVYCANAHRKPALYKLDNLWDHFCKDSNTSNRDKEVKYLNIWLKKLGEAVPSKEALDPASTNKTWMVKRASTVLEDITSPIQQVLVGYPQASPFTFEKRSDTMYLGDEMQVQRIGSWKVVVATQNLPSRRSPRLESRDTPEYLARTKLSREIPGYVYVFAHPQNAAYHKIGWAKNIEDRLDEWQQECGYVIEESSDILGRCRRRVAYPHRLEALIHRELKSQRVKVIKCHKACMSVHNEWFKIDSDAAQKCVKKWTKWMQKQPYDSDGNLKKGTKMPTDEPEENVPTFVDNRRPSSRSSETSEDSHKTLRTRSGASYKRPCTSSRRKEDIK